MALHRLAGIGMGLVTMMFVAFLASAFANGPNAFTALPALALVAAVAATVGFFMLPRRWALATLAGGLLGLAFLRVLLLGLFPPVDDVVGMLASVVSVASLGAGAFVALRWLTKPSTNGRGLGAALGGAAFAHFLDMAGAIGSGDFFAILGYLLGAVGFSFAAPFVDAPPVPPKAPRAPKPKRKKGAEQAAQQPSETPQ